MKPHFLFFFVTATCLTVCEAAMGAVTTSECSGDIPAQTTGYIDDSLRSIVSELPADEFGECVLKANGEKKPDGISLRVKLVCEGEETFEETRIVTSASAAAQARTMARNLLKESADSSMTETPNVETNDLEPVAEEEDEENHKTVAQTGIFTGTLIEALGFTGALGVSLVIILGQSSSSADKWFPVILVSGGVFTLGSVISTAAHTARHRAYMEAGFSPRANMVVISWLFTAVTLGFYIGATVELSDYKDEVSDMQAWGSFGASVFLFTLAITSDILDIALFRTLWRRDFYRADARAKPLVSVVPLVLGNRVGDNRSVAPGLGVMGTF